MAEGKSDKSEKPEEPKERGPGTATKIVAVVFATVFVPVFVTFGQKLSDIAISVVKKKVDAATAEDSQTAAATGKSPDATAKEPSGGSDAANIKDAAADVGTTAGSGAGTQDAGKVAEGGVSGEGSSSRESSFGSRGRGRKKAAKESARDSKPLESDPWKYRTTGPVVRLYNQKDRTGLTTWLEAAGKDKTPPGRNVDPENIFLFQQRQGQIKVSGRIYGVLLTEKEYSNYRLTLEYRWGQKTWGARDGKARQSGLLLHCGEEDGAYRDIAPHAIKVQIVEGGVGDLLCYGPDDSTNVSISAEMIVERPSLGKGGHKGPESTPLRKLYSWQPGEPVTTFTQGILRRTGNTDGWKDVAGFHREGDFELSGEEWNRLECVCLGERVRVFLNDTLVNEATSVRPSQGRIGIQSYGAEMFVRRLELQPIAKE